MTTSTSYSAYEDCFDIFEQALESKNGIKIRFADAGAAYQYRTRLHYARTLDRRKAKERIEDPTHPAYGASTYDRVIVQIRENGEGWWVLIRPRVVAGEVMEIEDGAAY